MWSSALVLSLMMVITPVAVASAGVAPVRPHVFFLLADDLGTSDIGYNDKSIISPTLDGLAREGIILSDHCEFTAVSARLDRYELHHETASWRAPHTSHSPSSTPFMAWPSICQQWTHTQ